MEIEERKEGRYEEEQRLQSTNSVVIEDRGCWLLLHT
jgi:hypothetical protein